MKKYIVTIVFSALSVFLMFGFSQAAVTQMIQPAATDVVYDSGLTVNGTGYFKSLRVGSQGVGGVTFFNGTIINETTYPGLGIGLPVTVGDDLRVDGAIWRGSMTGVGDGMPVKFADFVVPETTNLYNLGLPNLRWRDLYMAGKFYGEDVIVGNELWGGSYRGLQSGDDPLFVSDTMTPTMDDINDLGSATNRWQDLHLSGDLRGVTGNYTGSVTVGGGFGNTGITLFENGSLSMDGNLVVDGTITGTIDADTLDGIDSTGFALTGDLHTQNTDTGTNATTWTLRLGSNQGIINAIALTGDRAYSLPDSSGTIALTSDLSGYLPLAGGTMAGNINMDTSIIQNIGVSGTDFTAAGGLTIADDIDIDGDINFTSGNEKTRYYSIDAAAFTPDTVYDSSGGVAILDCQYNKGDGFVTSQNSDCILFAGVNLPHGASVTDITYRLYDSLGGGDEYTIELFSNTGLSGGTSAIANTQYTTSWADGSREVSAPGPISLTVDNNNYSYYFKVTDITSDSQWVGNVMIEYEISNPYP